MNRKKNEGRKGGEDREGSVFVCNTEKKRNCVVVRRALFWTTWSEFQFVSERVGSQEGEA